MILHPRFDADACARDLEEGATHASFVANMLARVLDTGRRFPAAIVLVGGGAAPRDLLARARAAGLEVLHTYGLTESASQVTCELPGEADGSSAGMPLPGTEVVIGANGEIEVRGRTLMLGYLGEPPIGEWLRTGDLGEIDPRGRLIVHARRTDLIVSGEAELGIHQISEIVPVNGVTLVGPLPPEIQNYTVYAAGIAAHAKQAEAAQALMKVLTGPAAAGVLKSRGMERAGS